MNTDLTVGSCPSQFVLADTDFVQKFWLITLPESFAKSQHSLLFPF